LANLPFLKLLFKLLLDFIRWWWLIRERCWVSRLMINISILIGLIFAIMMYLSKLFHNHSSLPVCFMLPNLSFLPRFFIFFFKRLISLDGTKLSDTLIMFLTFSFLDAPGSLILLYWSVILRTARIMLIYSLYVGVGVTIVSVLLMAFAAFLTPVLVALGIGGMWIVFSLTVWSISIWELRFFLYILRDKLIPLTFFLKPHLIL